MSFLNRLYMLSPVAQYDLLVFTRTAKGLPGMPEIIEETGDEFDDVAVDGDALCKAANECEQGGGGVGSVGAGAAVGGDGEAAAGRKVCGCVHVGIQGAGKGARERGSEGDGEMR